MQDSVDSGPELATVARETFEYSIIPWTGRKYEDWVRAWSRKDARDPNGLVQVPGSVFRAYQRRTPGQRLTREQAGELGYPRVPGEQELIRLRRELHDALGRSDWERAHDLDAQVRDLQERVDSMRLSALGSRSLART